MADRLRLSNVASGWPSLREFAASVLGWALEEKQVELLTGEVHRVMLNCTRQWGKSTLAAVMILYRALTEPEALILIAGPSLRQASELLFKVRKLAMAAGVMVRPDYAQARGLQLENGARVIALPHAPDRIRGFSNVSLIVIDEAAMVSDEMYLALRPMVTQSGGDLWLLSTPKGRRGFFHEEWTAGVDGWRRVMVRATDCPRFTAEMLGAERETMGERRFAQEFLCEFIELEAGMFNEAWFERTLGRGEPALVLE